jgi:hypothetical protein
MSDYSFICCSPTQTLAVLVVYKEKYKTKPQKGENYKHKESKRNIREG